MHRQPVKLYEKWQYRETTEVQVCENNWIKRIVGVKTADKRRMDQLRDNTNKHTASEKKLNVKEDICTIGLKGDTYVIVELAKGSYNGKQTNTSSCTSNCNASQTTNVQYISKVYTKAH